MKVKNKITIFSTGVHLQSVLCVISGMKQWRWVATGFEDDSFLNGRVINPIEYAKKQDDMVEKFQKIENCI